MSDFYRHARGACQHFDRHESPRMLAFDSLAWNQIFASAVPFKGCSDTKAHQPLSNLTLPISVVSISPISLHSFRSILSNMVAPERDIAVPDVAPATHSSQQEGPRPPRRVVGTGRSGVLCPEGLDMNILIQNDTRLILCQMDNINRNLNRCFSIISALNERISALDTRIG
ncbi:hypothetical protein DFS34DRAFT_611888 [Phlyctochytrium arcticum]|nr:hypothetical protein DFS34DRAFT_611888 [Phlyctochytrium arcticum]